MTTSINTSFVAISTMANAYATNNFAHLVGKDMVTFAEGKVYNVTYNDVNNKNNQTWTQVELKSGDKVSVELLGAIWKDGFSQLVGKSFTTEANGKEYTVKYNSNDKYDQTWTEIVATVPATVEPTVEIFKFKMSEMVAQFDSLESESAVEVGKALFAAQGQSLATSTETANFLGQSLDTYFEGAATIALARALNMNDTSMTHADRAKVLHTAHNAINDTLDMTQAEMLAVVKGGSVEIDRVSGKHGNMFTVDTLKTSLAGMTEAQAITFAQIFTPQNNLVVNASFTNQTIGQYAMTAIADSLNTSAFASQLTTDIKMQDAIQSFIPSLSDQEIILIGQGQTVYDLAIVG